MGKRRILSKVLSEKNNFLCVLASLWLSNFATNYTDLHELKFLTGLKEVPSVGERSRTIRGSRGSRRFSASPRLCVHFSRILQFIM